MPSSIVDTDTIGSAGTLISAALQSGAHYLQSALLDVIHAGLGSPLAAFLFAIAIIVALVTVAVGGNYKFGLWFLIGPALFYTAVIPRVPSSGVAWEFGGRVHGQRAVKEVTKGIYGENQGQQVGKVSSIFAKWDMFTSAVIQSLISSVQLIDAKSDLDFISRTDRFSSLFHLEVADGKLQTFLNLVVLDDCAGYLSLQHSRFHTLGMFKRTDIEQQLAQVEKRVVISSHDQNYGFIKKLYQDKYFGEDAPALKESYTCADLWDLATRALKIEAQNLILAVADPKGDDPRTTGEIERELSKKFKSLDEKKAKAKTPAEQQGIDEEKVDIMLNAIAVRMLYTAMAKFQKNRAHLDLVKDLRSPDGKGHYNTAADLRHFYDHSHEYDAKGNFLNLMMALPYIQGFILYFLAITYPFFAFALVVPGRHHTALLWLGLWFWAKSWDFGFAVVMLFDEILYYLLPHGPPMTKALMADPGKAFQVLFQADPTYSVYTYYQIMAGLLGSVPILTGLLVKRGAQDVFQGVDRGYHQFAGKLGGAFASYTRSMVSQDLAGQEERLKYEAGKAAYAASWQDPEVLRAYALGGGVKILEAIGDQLTRQGTPNVISNFVKNLGAGFTTEINRQQLAYGLKRQQVLVETAMWNQSYSDESLDLARKAIEVRYSTHGFAPSSYNAPDVVGLEVAKRNLQVGGFVAGAADIAVRDAISKTFSVN